MRFSILSLFVFAVSAGSAAAGVPGVFSSSDSVIPVATNSESQPIPSDAVGPTPATTVIPPAAATEPSSTLNASLPSISPSPSGEAGTGNSTLSSGIAAGSSVIQSVVSAASTALSPSESANANTNSNSSTSGAIVNGANGIAVGLAGVVLAILV